MADEVVGGAVVRLGIDGSDLAAQGSRAAAQVGAAMDKAEKAQGRVTKQIQANIDRINSTKAVASMQLLEQAVTQMGGRAKLNADQIARLTSEINRLSAAGAKIPKSLQLPSVGRGGAGIQAAATTALTGAGPGGALGAGLAAFGPGGLAAGAVVAGLAAITKGFIDQSDALDELSKKTGLSIATLDAWGTAAKTSGVSAETLAEATLKLSANIAQGDSVFERLGLRLENLRKLTPEQQFEAVAQRILELKTPGEQAAAALEAMGRDGSAALQALRDGFLGNLPEAKKHAAALEESRKEAAALKDDIDKLALEWDKLTASVGGFIASGLAPLLKRLNEQGLGGFSPTMLVFGGKGKGAPVAETTGAGTAAGTGSPTFESAAEIAARKAAAEKAAQEREAAARKAEAAQKKASEARLAAMRLEVQVARETEIARQKEIDLILGKGVAAEERKLMLMQLQRETAQAEADARARQVGSAESLADSRNRIIESKAGLEQEAAKRKEMLALVDQMAGKDTALAEALKQRLGLSEQVVGKTRDWNQELANAAHLMAAMPGLLGKVGSAFVSLQAGVASIGASLSNFGKNFGGQLKGLGSALTGGGATTLLGKAGNILGGLGAVGSIAGAAVGIGRAIVGLFRSDPVRKAQQQAGKAFGHEISREMAEQLLAESKQTGKSVTELATKMRRDQEREAAISKRRALEEGLSTFQAGFEQAQEALKDIEKSPALQAALAQIGASLDDALGKAGLFKTPEALKQSQAFGAAQTAAGGLAQAAAGARQAGVIDTALQAALGVASKELQAQAVAAAKAAGLGDAEAQKAGFGAVAGLLREQLNSQLQANGKVDAALQAQLDEAKANGIEILADPAIESLNVQKQQLDVLQQGFGVVADKVDAAGRMQAAAAAGVKVGTPGGSILDFPGARAMPGPAAFVDRDLMAQIQTAQAATEAGLDGIRALIENIGPTTVMSEVNANIQMDPFAINETRQEALRAAIDAVKTLARNRDADFLAALDGR